MFTFDEKTFFAYFRNLLAIDSTTGQYEEIQDYIKKECEILGYPAYETHKGGLIVSVGGSGNHLAVSSHMDAIGLMVRKINSDGTLNVCPVGGLYPFYCVGANVNIHTRDGKIYTGTVCRTPNSVHVTEDEIRKNPGDFRTNVCVVPDLPVRSAEDTRSFGIETGDMIALDPDLKVSGGYIKSRYIDDKAMVAIMLTVLEYLKKEQLAPARKVSFYFSAYEEIGHGTSWLPEDTADFLALDIAPTGPDQNSDETRVSVFAKDSRYPFHWAMTNELRSCAAENGIDYVMDVFTPHYGTDAETSLTAGYDIRHAAIGPGTANSHGYERTHIDGIKNTYLLTLAYMMK